MVSLSAGLETSDVATFIRDAVSRRTRLFGSLLYLIQVESQARTIECYVSHLLSPFQAFLSTMLYLRRLRFVRWSSHFRVGRVRQDAEFSLSHGCMYVQLNIMHELSPAV
jgi:hypothetical protein